MSRWVLGSLVAALAVAPLGFGMIAGQVVATTAKLIFALLVAAAIVFSGLAMIWERRWAV